MTWHRPHRRGRSWGRRSGSPALCSSPRRVSPCCWPPSRGVSAKPCRWSCQSRGQTGPQWASSLIILRARRAARL